MLAQTQIIQDLTISKTPGGFMTLGGKADATAQSMGNPFQSLMKSLMAHVEQGEHLNMNSLISMMNLEGASEKKSTDLLALLVGKIEDTGTIPSGRFVGDEGLEALEKILTGLGFDEKKVGKFIHTLKQDQETNDISLSSLLSKLGTFVEENDCEDELELSALPYLTSLLNSFDLAPRQVDQIMKKAVQSGTGINLDVLVTDLKKIQTFQDEPQEPSASGQKTMVKGQGGSQKASAYSLATLIKGQDGSQTASAYGQETLVKGLGLEVEKTGTLTIDEFVTKLETLIREKNPSRSSSGTLESLSRIFADSVHTGTNKKTTDGVSFRTQRDNTTGDNDPIRFESPKVKSPQPLSRNATESEFFSGAKPEVLKAGGKEVSNELPASFEKSLKKSLSTKDSQDTPDFSTKALSGTDIYGKVSDMKATASTEKTLPSYVTDQVARQISKSVKLGDSEITFSIRPPEMGRVQLKIENTKDGMKINIITEHHATRDMILSHSADLRSMLTDQGIRLDKLDVDVSGSFGQSMAQARKDAEDSGKERKNKNKDSFNLDGVAEKNTGEPTIRSWRHTRGNLDLVA